MLVIKSNGDYWRWKPWRRFAFRIVSKEDS